MTTAIGLVLNKMVFTNIALNYMLMGVAFSAPHQIDIVNRPHRPLKAPLYRRPVPLRSIQ